MRECIFGIPQTVQTEASTPEMFLNEVPKQVQTWEHPSIHQLRHRNRVLQEWKPESHVDICSVFCVGQDPLCLSPGLLAALFLPPG